MVRPSKSINSLHPVNNSNDYSRTCVYRSLILLAYENGDCPAISVPQNGSVAQEALNLLNQAKVYMSFSANRKISMR